MATEENSRDINIPAYGGAYEGHQTRWEPGTFIDRIRDREVREELALHVSTNGFYGFLDRGEPLEDALKCSMSLAISNMHLLNRMVEDGEVPDYTWPESNWHAALDAAEANERPDYEPGRIRKWLAKTVLRQEVDTRKYVIDLAPWRKRSPTAAEGIS